MLLFLCLHRSGPNLIVNSSTRRVFVPARFGGFTYLGAPHVDSKSDFGFHQFAKSTKEFWCTKCVTWILLLPRHPTWILHLPRRRRGSFIFLVTQEVNNVDNTYILVANVDSIVSSSHRNCTTWIFKHPRLSSWIFKVPRHTEIS